MTDVCVCLWSPGEALHLGRVGQRSEEAAGRSASPHRHLHPTAIPGEHPVSQRGRWVLWDGVDTEGDVNVCVQGSEQAAVGGSGKKSSGSSHQTGTGLP